MLIWMVQNSILYKLQSRNEKEGASLRCHMETLSPPLSPPPSPPPSPSLAGPGPAPLYPGSWRHMKMVVVVLH